jgi:hypothetical protein
MPNAGSTTVAGPFSSPLASIATTGSPGVQAEASITDQIYAGAPVAPAGYMLHDTNDCGQNGGTESIFFDGGENQRIEDCAAQCEQWYTCQGFNFIYNANLGLIGRCVGKGINLQEETECKLLMGREGMAFYRRTNSFGATAAVSQTMSDAANAAAAAAEALSTGALNGDDVYGDDDWLDSGLASASKTAGKALAALVGGVIGGLVLVCVLIGIAYFCCATGNRSMGGTRKGTALIFENPTYEHGGGISGPTTVVAPLNHRQLLPIADLQRLAGAGTERAANPDCASFARKDSMFDHSNIIPVDDSQC